MDIAGGSGLAIVQSALYPHRAHVAEEMLMATLLFVQLEITRQHNRVMAREVSATEGVSLDDQRWGFWPLLPFGWCCRLRRALHPQGHGDVPGLRHQPFGDRRQLPDGIAFSRGMERGGPSAAVPLVDWRWFRFPASSTFGFPRALATLAPGICCVAAGVSGVKRR